MKYTTLANGNFVGAVLRVRWLRPLHLPGQPLRRPSAGTTAASHQLQDSWAQQLMQPQATRLQESM